MQVYQPEWYRKQLQEVREGKRHEWPCNGVFVERRSGSWECEGEHIYWKECHRCGEKVEWGD